MFNNQRITIYLPTQNLLSDAECKICKYKSLIISAYSSNYGGQILGRGTVEGRKIYKNLQLTEENEVKYDCLQKKKKRTSAKSIFQFFARLHFLMQIFAHSCIKV